MPHSADELLRRHARLLSERVVWEFHWAEVVQHVLPRSDFFMGRRNPGEKHTGAGGQCSFSFSHGLQM
jgi:hypothetical protein